MIVCDWIQVRFGDFGTYAEGVRPVRYMGFPGWTGDAGVALELHYHRAGMNGGERRRRAAAVHGRRASRSEVQFPRVDRSDRHAGFVPSVRWFRAVVDIYLPLHSSRRRHRGGTDCDLTHALIRHIIGSGDFQRGRHLPLPLPLLDAGIVCALCVNDHG